MPESNFHIRSASFGDMDAILNLWQNMMCEHQTGDGRVRLASGAESAYRSYVGYHLANSDSLVLAAASSENSVEIVGFALMVISRNLPMFLPPRYGYLSDLAVDSAWRRHGV